MTLVGGAVNLDASTALSVSTVNAFAPGGSDAYYILTRADSGTFSNTFNGLAEGALVGNFSGVDLFITYVANWTGLQGTSSLTGGNDVALFATAVPEPGTFALLGLVAGLGCLAWRRRRVA
jgi:hypothetical protein